MNNVVHKSNFKPLQPGEFKANLPPLRKINLEILEYREQNGVKKTLDKATQIANLPFMADDVSKRTREDARHLIAACNYSAAQVRKEIKSRQ